jgi:hypothetical protein
MCASFSTKTSPPPLHHGHHAPRSPENRGLAAFEPNRIFFCRVTAADLLIGMRPLTTHSVLAADDIARLLLLLLLLPSSLLLSTSTSSSNDAVLASSHTSTLTTSPDASAWAAALVLNTSSAQCSCSHLSHWQEDYEPFTHCYWACQLSHAVSDEKMSLMQHLGSFFKACAVSLITGEDYLEGAAVMTHSYAAFGPVLRPSQQAVCVFMLLFQVLQNRQ